MPGKPTDLNNVPGTEVSSGNADDTATRRRINHPVNRLARVIQRELKDPNDVRYE